MPLPSWEEDREEKPNLTHGQVKEYVSSSLYLGLFIDTEMDLNFMRLGHQIDIMIIIFALLTGSVQFNIFIS